MRNLREVMVEKCTEAVKSLEAQIEQYRSMRQKILDTQGIDISVDEDTTAVTIHAWGSIYVQCHSAGEAQRVAGEMSLGMELEFGKNFLDRTGVHEYGAYDDKTQIRYWIEGIPGDECKIEWVEEETVQKMRKARIKCDDTV